MPRVIFAVAVLAFSVYCAVDAVQTDDDRVRGLPKALWALICLLIPVAGGLAWLIAGRPAPVPPPSSWQRPAPPRGPDDDPDFLRGL